MVAAAGTPQPEEAVVLNGALMILAGLLLGLDIAPRLVADPVNISATMYTRRGPL